MGKLRKSAVICLLISVILSVWYHLTFIKILLPFAITFGTAAYHLVMRLLVGAGYNLIMRNQADYKKRRYQTNRQEMMLYEWLKVKNWKSKMPTYDDLLFDPKRHTWEEIIQSMCQAEQVHESIAVLSFLPITAGFWFGCFPVFIITSAAAALVDMTFVVLQRYNRQRICEMLEKEKDNQDHEF
jgi:hypothetical protein